MGLGCCDELQESKQTTNTHRQQQANSIKILHRHQHLTAKLSNYWTWGFDIWQGLHYGPLNEFYCGHKL